MVVAARVDLPNETRPVGGLLAAARPLTGAWTRGVVFRKGSCLGPEGFPFCPPGPTTKELGGPGELASFHPIGIVQGIACTTLSRDSAEATATSALSLTRDWMLGQELAYGSVSDHNPSLADATALPAVAGLVDALAALEDAIAGGLYGRLGYVHVSYGTLTRLVAARAIWRDGGTWRTAAGNTVVSSAGYDFAGLYATGEVYAAVGEQASFSDTDRSINQTEAYAEEVGIAVFDPCFVVSVGLEE